MTKINEYIELKCKLCDKIIGGISMPHALANLKTHNSTSKMHKRLSRKLKKLKKEVKK